MFVQSTRSDYKADDLHAVLEGLAPDGGLFVDADLGSRPFDWRSCLSLPPLGMAEANKALATCSIFRRAALRLRVNCAAVGTKLLSKPLGSTTSGRLSSSSSHSFAVMSLTVVKQST